MKTVLALILLVIISGCSMRDFNRTMNNATAGWEQDYEYYNQQEQERLRMEQEVRNRIYAQGGTYQEPTINQEQALPYFLHCHASPASMGLKREKATTQCHDLKVCFY